MIACPEKDAWRSVQLRDHNTFRSIDDEGSFWSHVRDHPQVNILDDRFKVLVFGIRAVKLQLGLQRDTVGQPPLNAFIKGITWRIDKIIQELQYKIIPGICDGEILGKDLVQALTNPVLRIGFQLEKVPEGLQLNIKKVGILRYEFCCTEINSLDIF